MKKLLTEFKNFAIKGNVIDLATAVIIGGAFGKIVSSLVADIIMPLIGLISGSGDFSNWQILLRKEIGDSPALYLNSGLFVQAIVDFLIISASIFLMIKLITQVKSRLIKEEEKPKEPSPEVKLLQEIRDELRAKNRQ